MMDDDNDSQHNDQSKGDPNKDTKGQAQESKEPTNVLQGAFDNKKTIIKPRPGGQKPFASNDSIQNDSLQQDPSATAVLEDERVTTTVSKTGTTTVSKTSTTTAVPDHLVIDDISGDLPTHSSLNPLLHAGATVLSIIQSLQASATLPATYLFEDVTQEMKRFLNRARVSDRELDPNDLNTASELLCCFIDESIRKMPWRNQTQWADKTLLFTLHAQNNGGEYFYRLVDDLLLRHDDKRFHLIELAYTLLNLGFEGLYFRLPNGNSPPELREKHNHLYQHIQSLRGQPEKALSINWKGSQRAQKKLTRLWPLALSIAAALGLLIALYAVLLFELTRSATPVLHSMNALGKLLSFEETAFKPIETNVPPATPAPSEVSLRERLADEVTAGTLTVERRGRYEAIVLEGDRYFDSGSGSVKTDSLAVIARIRTVLASVQGSLAITGHTDNIPIRSMQFPSNWVLSKARAQSVADALALDQRSMTVQGLGEFEPRFNNDSAQNRARNRRVEILVLSSTAGGPY